MSHNGSNHDPIARRQIADARVKETLDMRRKIEGWIARLNRLDLTPIDEIREFDEYNDLMCLGDEATTLSEAERDEHVNDILFCRMAAYILKGYAKRHPDDLRQQLMKKKLIIKAPKPGRNWQEYSKRTTEEQLKRAQLATELPEDEMRQMAAESVQKVKAVKVMIERWLARLQDHDETVLPEINAYDEFDPALDIDPIAAVILGSDDFKEYVDSVTYLCGVIRGMQMFTDREPGEVWEMLDYIVPKETDSQC